MKTFTTLLTLSLISTLSVSSFANELDSTSAVTSTTEKAQRPALTETFTLKVKPNIGIETGKEVSITASTMKTAKVIMEMKLHNAGFTDHSFTVSGSEIKLQLPKLSQGQFTKIKTLLTASHKLTIHKRHPQSDKLAQQVFDGTETVIGYLAYPEEIVDEAGALIDTRYHLVKRKPAVSGQDIAAAWPDRVSNSQVFIELTEQGGNKMMAFTRSLKPGRDMIVTVIDGKVINAATLQAEVLGKNFVISGLDNLQQCEDLAKGLSNPLINDVELIKHESTSSQKNKPSNTN